jgi:hypothetical protein
VKQVTRNQMVASGAPTFGRNIDINLRDDCVLAWRRGVAQWRLETTASMLNKRRLFQSWRHSVALNGNNGGGTNRRRGAALGARTSGGHRRDDDEEPKRDDFESGGMCRVRKRHDIRNGGDLSSTSIIQHHRRIGDGSAS